MVHPRSAELAVDYIKNSSRRAISHTTASRSPEKPYVMGANFSASANFAWWSARARALLAFTFSILLCTNANGPPPRSRPRPRSRRPNKRTIAIVVVRWYDLSSGACPRSCAMMAEWQAWDGGFRVSERSRVNLCAIVRGNLPRGGRYHFARSL